VLNLEARAAGKVEIDLLSLAHATFKEAFKGDSLGAFDFDTNRGDEDLFNIDTKTGQLSSKAALNTTSDSANNSEHLIAVKYTTRDATPLVYKFTIDLDVTAGAVSSLSGIKVENTVNAGHAIESLDKALEEVSTAQAKLGAIQNRLSHNIDNLSKSSMLTEQSVGRVIDADFATETSNLSKQQILAQAATAMLAQANQSKQSVLSLLQ
jgi:flagellin-like hook-associated protein FlgL